MEKIFENTIVKKQKKQSDEKIERIINAWIFSDAIVKAMDDSSSIRAFSEDFSQEVVIFKNSKGDFILESWNGGLLELTVRYDHWPLNYLLSSFAWLK